MVGPGNRRRFSGISCRYDDDGIRVGSAQRRIWLQFELEQHAPQSIVLLPEYGDCLLAEFRAMLVHPKIAAFLNRDSRSQIRDAELTVENKSPIAVRAGDRLLIGRVDRVVTIYDGDQPLAAETLDFKTDAFAPHDAIRAAKGVESYRPQFSSCVSAIRSTDRFESGQVSTKLLSIDAAIVEELQC